MSNSEAATTEALLWDSERVAHDPSVAVRRALWLDAQACVKELLLRHNVPVPPMLNRYLIHNLVFLPSISLPSEFVRKSIELYPVEFAELLQREADVFVAVAEVGEPWQLDKITEWVMMADKQGVVHVDLARMMKLACVNGRTQVVNWLLGKSNKLQPTQGESVSEALRRGLQRAVDQLVAIGREEVARAVIESIKSSPGQGDGVVDLVIVGRTSINAGVTGLSADASKGSLPSAVATSARKMVSSVASSVAFRVFTTARLVHKIGEYQETLSGALDHFIGSSKLWCSVGDFNFLDGGYVRSAIVENNLYVLRVVHQMTRVAYHRYARSFAFEHAMDLAACEGRIHILELLHTLDNFP